MYGVQDNEDSINTQINLKKGHQQDCTVANQFPIKMQKYSNLAVASVKLNGESNAFIQIDCSMGPRGWDINHLSSMLDTLNELPKLAP